MFELQLKFPDMLSTITLVATPLATPSQWLVTMLVTHTQPFSRDQEEILSSGNINLVLTPHPH